MNGRAHLWTGRVLSDRSWTEFQGDRIVCARRRNLYKHQKFEHEHSIGVVYTVWNVWVSFSSFALHQMRSAENAEDRVSERMKTVELCVWEKFYGFLAHLLLILFGLSLHAVTIVDAKFFFFSISESTECLTRMNCAQISNTNANTTIY